MSNKNIKFTILLDEATNKQLMGLKHAEHMSKGAFIRALINRCATMTYSREPTCADGQRCMCPQMHHYAPSATAAFPGTVPPDPDTIPRAPFAFDPTVPYLPPGGPPTDPVRDPEGPPNDPDPMGPIKKPPAAT